MAQQPQGRLRRFLPTPLGRIVLILVAVLVVFASYAYISVIIAIPAILLFGLLLPIWAGLKRPRYLALAGLVIILTIAPLTTAVITQEILAPSGPSASASGSPFSNGAPLMQNASVSPFTGTTGTNFTWTVTVYPAYHPLGNTTPTELDLFISTCPGATGNSSPSCAQPYPFFELENKSLPNVMTPYTVTFHFRIGSNGIWAWQMGIYTENTTNKTVRLFQLLVGDPTYNGIEGPVIGGFVTIYFELLPSLYFQDFLFLGAPFYCILLVYMLFKNRERRRKDAQQRAMGPVPPSGEGAPTTPSGPGTAPLPSSKAPPGPGATAAAAPVVQELNCPKCNAVVYEGEKTCWKCGASLAGAPSGGSTGSA